MAEPPEFTEDEIANGINTACRDQFWAVLDDMAALWRLSDLAGDDDWTADEMLDRALDCLPEIEGGYSRQAMLMAALDGMNAAFNATYHETN